MSVDVSGSSLDDLLRQDWLAVNHLGGYASSTPTGLNTRKYHGLLVAAMSPPVRRMVLLSRVEETIFAHGQSFSLSAAEYPGTIHPPGFERLVAFDPSPFPRWAFQADGWTLQKELRLLPQRNAVSLQYTLLGCNSPVTLEVRPLLAMRDIHELMYQWNGRLETTPLAPGHLRIDATARTPEVFLAHDGEFNQQPLWYLNNIYRQEQQRGYPALEDLWTPGTVKWTLSPGRTVHFICSADPVLLDQAVHEANDPVITIETGKSSLENDVQASALLQAASKFAPIMHSDPVEPTARLITRYPWSPPIGRDALIALPGLLLTTKRYNEAAILLDSFVHDLSRGLMPSVYPEDGSAPRYDGVDVSLWFVHAVDRYLHATGEAPTTHLPWIDVIDRIIDAYQSGAASTETLRICMDADGLIRTHAAGHAASWMDAAINTDALLGHDAAIADVLVTPRDGRAVEINALWYNSLCVASELSQSVGKLARSETLAQLAASVQRAFVEHFWDEQRRYCHDVVGDPSLRPNQLFAVSLPHAVLPKQYHAAVLNAVRTHLLTPLGVRTLDPRDERYVGYYCGDPASRARAQHQGSAYPWLLGAYCDALLSVRGDDVSVRNEIAGVLSGCFKFIRGNGLGNLPELFDGSSLHNREVHNREVQNLGGAIASVRSVAEVLRAYACCAIHLELSLNLPTSKSFSPSDL